MGFPIDQLEAALRAAGLSVLGCALVPAVHETDGAVTFHTRPEGQIRVDWTATPTAGQQTTAGTTVTGFDASAAAQATRKNVADRAGAKALLADAANTGKVLRALLAGIVDEINLLRAMPRAVTSITRSGTTATATTPVAHGLTTGAQVVIAGAVQTAYNGTFTVTVTTATAFTYQVAGSPATPATGSISYTLSPRTLSGAIASTQAKIDADA